jgi:hypothetical protein
LFCSKQCFNYHQKTLEAAASKAKGRVPLQTDGPMPEINSMTVMIYWLTMVGSQWHGRNKQNGTTKKGIANKISQIIKDKRITMEWTVREPSLLMLKMLDPQVNTTSD